MAIDIAVDTTKSGTDQVGIILTPTQAEDLAYHLQDGARDYREKGEETFYIAFAYSFILSP